MKSLNSIALILAILSTFYSVTSIAQCALTGEVVLHNYLASNPENTFDNNVIYFQALDTLGNCPDASYLVFNWSSEDLQGSPADLSYPLDFNWFKAFYPGPGAYEVCVEVLAYNSNDELIASIINCQDIVVGCGDWTFHAFTSLRNEEQIVVETFENFAYGDFTYLWYINNVLQENETSSILTIDNPSYPVYVDVEVVNTYGCSRSRDLDYLEPRPLCDFDFIFEVVDNHVFIHEVFEGQMVSASYSNPHFVTYLSDYDALFDYTESGAEFTFDELGVYEVCASIQNSTCIYSECIEVEITNISSECEAIIEMNNWGYMYGFSNASTGTFSEATWVIDGEESSGLWGDGFFAEPGETHVVELYISNPLSGCSSSTSLEVEIPQGEIICGYAYEDINENGVKDPDEPGVPEVFIWHGITSISTDEEGRYEIYLHPNDFEGILYFENAGSGYRFLDYPDPYNVEYNYSESNLGDCSTNFRMTPDSITVCGVAFSDVNNNWLYDIGEPHLPGVEIFEVLLNEYSWPTEVMSAFTNEQGEYCMTHKRSDLTYLDARFEVNGNTMYGSIPNESVIALAEPGSVVYNANFRFGFSFQEADPRVWCYEELAIPGLQDNYYLQVRNYGTEQSTVNVELILPLEIQCIAASSIFGVEGVISAGGNAIEWQNVVVPPQGFSSVVVTILPSTTIQIGSVHSYTFSLEVVDGEDSNLSNNFKQNDIIVIGPYDPNNKLVIPAGEGPQGQMLPTNDPFLYTINFQNIGSAPAINVVIDDQLDDDLNLGSFEVISASHDYFVTIDSDGFSRWTFPNINLPDSTTNEPESHGQVRYKIAPKLNRPVGTVFENTAYIYFDFNEAIITNTTVNTFVNIVNVPEKEPEMLFVKPNPANNYVIVSSNLLDGNASVRLLDMQGRLVLEQKVTAMNQFELPLTIEAGYYILQIQNRENIGATRLIVK